MSRVAILTGLLAIAFAGHVGASPLTVVGFNVQSDNSSDLVIGRQLERSSDIDIWGLTEIYREGGWVERMRVAAGVGEGTGFAALVGKTGKGNESLIVYRSDRLVLLGSEELTSVVEGQRAAPLVARFLLDGETEFLFVLVRLSNRAGTRREQALRLADWGATQSLPLIAAGTFGFGVPEGGMAGDDAMATLLAATQWQWVRPADAFATACGRSRLVEDFVFAGGAARDWAGVARVSFQQNNYCKDDESDRTSDFRPVVAAFSTDGSTDAVAGVMPERQIGPFLPTTVSPSEVREAREDVSQPGAATSDGGTRPLVTEAGSTPAVPAAPVTPPGGSTTPPAGSSSAAPPAVVEAAPGYPVAPPAAVGAVPASPAEPTAAAEVAPAAPAADPEREALMRRLEALEREAREIREALEEEE